MQAPSLSGANSHSISDRTLVGSDNGSFNRWDGIASPIIQTPDQKQWIDLELLNPKLLKGLSQYAPSVQDEPNSKIGKGAAKIKAWARQSKAGIEIRLRRKINNDRDEITDIRLVPDAYPADTAASREKKPFMHELPGMRSIAELPDTTTMAELDATQSGQPSRSSTNSTIGEPLPRYEREPAFSTVNRLDRSVDSTAPTHTTPDSNSDSSNAEAPSVAPAEIRHRPSFSQSSIVATPTRGLSIRGSDESPAASSATGDAKNDSDLQAESLRADLEDANKKLAEERQLSESLQAILQALNEEQTQQLEPTEAREPVKGEQVKRPRFNLKVANRTTYETETEHEPPSTPPNNRRKAPGPSRKKKKSVALPTRKQPGAHSRSGSDPLSDSSDDELDAATGTLIRKQTLPKRVPAEAGIEAVWRSLIRMQAILLGPEHRLTVQAKADLIIRRASEKLEPPADLTALEQTSVIADRDFGTNHPWVAAFTEDLEKLRILTRRQIATSDVRTRRSVMSTSSVEPRSAGIDSPQIDGAASSSPPRVTIVEATDSSTVAAGRSLHRIDTSVEAQSPQKDPSPVVGGVEIDAELDMMWNTGRLPHKPQSNHVAFMRLGFAALGRAAWSGIDWLQKNYGPEQAVETGKTRVRWTCSCGERLHDDFIEKRPGAARALEAYLNRPRGSGWAPPRSVSTQSRPSYNGNSPTTAGSSPGRQSFGSSFGAPPSSHTSYSGNSFPGPNGNADSKSQPPWTGTGPMHLPFSPTYEPPWLLTCATEDRLTPKVTHLDMSPHKIHSDKDLAIALRAHYFHLNSRWWRSLRLRGLTTIEFVQFEVHRNRFADIRKVPDVPLSGRGDYHFEPSDLLPPVGSQYLLHLFRHPEDYDGELITYLRAPKKHGRLQLGVGWGINLVEGFLADKVWVWMSAMFATGSLVFGVVYAVKKHDVQGAFGVAAWIVSLAALAAGWLQACLG